MTFSLRHDCGSHRLLLLFGGWSAEHAWFDHCAPAGYDLMTVCDYTSESTDSATLRRLESYEEICVVAWSFGVPVATRFIASHPALRFTTRIAVNGTITPVDDLTGIPTAIFEGTLASLASEAESVSDPAASRTLRKFDRRMCGGSSSLQRTRTLHTLTEELRAIRAAGPTASLSAASSTWLTSLHQVWDLAVISDSDAIIPTANQLAAWEGHVPHLTVKGAHMPDFTTLIDRLLIDKELVARRFAKSGSTTYSTSATAQRLIAEKVASFIPALTPSDTDSCPHVCLEFGVGAGLLTRLYAPTLPEDCDLTLCDISHISTDLPGRHVIADAETLIRQLPDASCDIILASSVMQWFNSPLRFITHVVRVLRPGGTAVLSTFAPDNFPELQTMLSRPLLTPGPQAYIHLLEELSTSTPLTFSVTTDTITLTFDTPRQLLAHLKATGVNSLSADHAESTRSAMAIMRSGVTSLTYRPLYLTIHRP